MSSSYRILCLSHDPALVIDGLAWDRRDGVLGVLRQESLSVFLPDHFRCDLLITRSSGGLVEIGCPPHDRHPRDAQWLDAWAARLVLAAFDAPQDPALRAALDRLPPCWSYRRLDRLRDELGVGR